LTHTFISTAPVPPWLNEEEVGGGPAAVYLFVITQIARNGYLRFNP